MSWRRIANTKQATSLGDITANASFTISQSAASSTPPEVLRAVVCEPTEEGHPAILQPRLETV